MAITKGYQALVDEAMAQVKTYTVEEVRARLGDPALQVVDIRDVRELQAEGTPSHGQRLHRTMHDIARILGRSEAACRQIVHRARERAGRSNGSPGKDRSPSCPTRMAATCTAWSGAAPPRPRPVCWALTPSPS